MIQEWGDLKLSLNYEESTCYEVWRTLKKMETGSNGYMIHAWIRFVCV